MALLVRPLSVLAPVVVLLGLVAGLRVVVRWRRSRGLERRQLRWRAVGVLVALALFPLAVTERLSPVVDLLDPVVFVATLLVPVLWYGLWDVGVVVRRSTVYAALTVVLGAGYVAVVAVGASVVPERVAAPLGAAAVAVAFAPVRSRVQRFVDRLFHGGARDRTGRSRTSRSGSAQRDRRGQSSTRSSAPSGSRCGCRTPRCSARRRAFCSRPRGTPRASTTRAARSGGWRSGASRSGCSSPCRAAARRRSAPPTGTCSEPSRSRPGRRCTRSR